MSPSTATARSPSLIPQKIVLGLILLLLGLGIWQTQTRLRAAVLFEQSQQLQEAWMESPELLTRENWQSAREDLLAATQLVSNAEYLNRYGLLLDSERSLTGQDISQEQTQQILANAIETHVLAIQQQPTAPIGWAYLARAKALAGQLDEFYDLALERVYTLGPWVANNQVMVAQLVQYYWPYMSQNGQYYAGSMVQLALSNPGNDARVLGVLRGTEVFLNDFCPLLDWSVLTETSLAACQIEP